MCVCMYVCMACIHMNGVCMHSLHTYSIQVYTCRHVNTASQNLQNISRMQLEILNKSAVLLISCH